MSDEFGTDTATAAHRVKVRQYEAAKQLYDLDVVHVSFGYPGGGRDKQDFVAFMEVRTEQLDATMTPQRTKDEDVIVTVIFSCARAGEDEDDLAPSVAAYDLLRTLERHLRMVDTTLGGACRWTRLDNTQSGGATDKQLLQQGRLIQIEAEFRSRVRITG